MMRLSMFMSVAAVAGVSILTSCTTADKDYFNEENVKTVYEQNFIKAFGKPAANHTWGFGTKAVNEVKQSRATDPNSNQWADYVIVPPAISDQEAQDVYNAFLNATGEVSEQLNWTDFFVQHVWKGTDKYKANNGGEVIGGNQMDRLVTYLADGSEDHVFNFNNAKGSIMLMKNSGTTDFAYNNSTDSKLHHEYIVLYVEKYDSYYVGFDFFANGQNPNQQVDRDYVFTDWIVKVSPAQMKNATRVMCEDLGTTDDFDFNDVVFDVAYDNNEAVITLQAAGGTMPLTVEGVEVHKAFGVATSEMVNTGKGPKLAPVVFRKQVRSTNLNDIAVVVNNTQTAQTYTLEAEQGKVPYKIAVPVTVKWAGERVKINTAYPKFNEWVADPTKPFWE